MHNIHYMYIKNFNCGINMSCAHCPPRNCVDIIVNFNISCDSGQCAAPCARHDKFAGQVEQAVGHREQNWQRPYSQHQLADGADQSIPGRGQQGMQLLSPLESLQCFLEFLCFC